jgi:hypothetical protein
MVKFEVGWITLQRKLKTASWLHGGFMLLDLPAKSEYLHPCIGVITGRMPNPEQSCGGSILAFLRNRRH